MGNKPVKTIILVGPQGSGKTHFLDKLVYGGDTTKIPTCGKYLADYEYNGYKLQFIEYAGRPAFREMWSCFLKEEKSVDALYVFLRNEDEILEMACHVMALLVDRLPEKVQLVVLISELSSRERVKRIFQLEELQRQGWPTLLVYLKEEEWGTIVEQLFETTTNLGVERINYREKCYSSFYLL